MKECPRILVAESPYDKELAERLVELIKSYDFPVSTCVLSDKFFIDLPTRIPSPEYFSGKITMKVLKSR